MKTTPIAAAIGLGFGLLLVWVDRHFSGAPDWLAWVNFPGIFLGTCVFMLTDGTLSAASVCCAAGISVQSLCLGTMAGFMISKRHAHRRRT